MNFNKTNKLFTIEGDIGSGKTTLINTLRAKYEKNKKIMFLKEPVDDWLNIKDKDGLSMVEKFYRDQEKYSFSFQMMAFISRSAIVRKAMRENPGAIFITERCLLTDKYVFAKMLHDQNKIEDVNYEIYLKWFDEFANEFPIESIIYVKTDPKVCHKRISKRARVGEDVIPLEYLIDCDKYHNEYIETVRPIISGEVLELDGNEDIYKKPEILDEWLNKIDQLLFE